MLAGRCSSGRWRHRPPPSTLRPKIRNDEAYFRAKIGSVKTAEQLVSDRRLLKVALGAFGLEADINNRFHPQSA